MSKTEIKWLEHPEDRDYPAAESYLTLLYKKTVVTHLLVALRVAPITIFRAKDIFRASSLSLLGVSDSHVEKMRKKILNDKSMSPLLLVRDGKGGLIIADGYHRLCAVYGFDEDAEVPCQIVSLDDLDLIETHG